MSCMWYKQLFLRYKPILTYLQCMHQKYLEYIKYLICPFLCVIDSTSMSIVFYCARNCFSVCVWIGLHTNRSANFILRLLDDVAYVVYASGSRRCLIVCHTFACLFHF